MKIIFTDVIEAQFLRIFIARVSPFTALTIGNMRRGCYKERQSIIEKYFQMRVLPKGHEDGYRRSAAGRNAPL
ncbi:hypothetical protein LAD48_22855 [Klebsiella pneumoniae]|nr:hypothetical protein [Klebsiella pneumoniae]HDT5089415.1 hypothetical protein [Klebsiella pneumoniae subsp. pneumoniae]MBW6003939.1 hypothetical protein [Klebsiella pneumoniae]MCQ8417576.1 hypothetical protein [Klebsiella pneumoniae]MCX9984856.1 hypothetical protein [Klebsiella pneumoniae]